MNCFKRYSLKSRSKVESPLSPLFTKGVNDAVKGVNDGMKGVNENVRCTMYGAEYAKNTEGSSRLHRKPPFA